MTERNTYSMTATNKPKSGEAQRSAIPPLAVWASAQRLSPRLQAVADFVPEGEAVVDVGTDHGYIPIYLVETGKAPRAFAMDVGKGPLERAKAHVQQLNPQIRERITLRLSDGLKELKPGEAGAVVIAGMGGDLMMRILNEGRHVWDTVKTWVLSPQSEPERVRRFLEEEGFAILREMMVKDGGKYYTVMEVRRGTMKLEHEEDYWYGPCLIKEKSPVLLEYLAQEEGRICGILSGFERQKPEQWTKGQLAAAGGLREELERIKNARLRMRDEENRAHQH